jgi:hypothetical protein
VGFLNQAREFVVTEITFDKLHTLLKDDSMHTSFPEAMIALLRLGWLADSCYDTLKLDLLVYMNVNLKFEYSVSWLVTNRRANIKYNIVRRTYKP